MEQKVKQDSIQLGKNMNILEAGDRESGNLEIGVPVLGNQLFCA